MDKNWLISSIVLKKLLLISFAIVTNSTISVLNYPAKFEIAINKTAHREISSHVTKCSIGQPNTELAIKIVS